jgi:hypothetical protein
MVKNSDDPKAAKDRFFSALIRNRCPKPEQPKSKRLPALAELNPLTPEEVAELRSKAKENSTFYRKMLDPLLMRRSPTCTLKPRRRRRAQKRYLPNFGRRPRRTNGC